MVEVAMRRNASLKSSQRDSSEYKELRSVRRFENDDSAMFSHGSFTTILRQDKDDEQHQHGQVSCHI